MLNAIYQGGVWREIFGNRTFAASSFHIEPDLNSADVGNYVAALNNFLK